VQLNHKGKDIREIIKERVAGKSYIRKEAPRTQLLTAPRLRTVAQSIMGSIDSSKDALQKEVENPYAKDKFKLNTPTLVQKLKPESKAKLQVASAHTTLSQATIAADFAAKTQAHRNAKLGFTWVPKAIQNL
jgi:hypothetical protein